MLISEYLRLRGEIAVTTGTKLPGASNTQAPTTAEGKTFAELLQSRLSEESPIAFSKHAMERVAQRGIDVTSGNLLERLGKGVELAEQKGSRDALVLVDTTAFVVSVKNHKVVTALDQNEMQGNVFTNIDATVII